MTQVKEAMNETKELTGDDGGHWRVFTQRTTYDFDLDAGTVTRIPVPDSSRTINDCEHRILEIDVPEHLGARIDVVAPGRELASHG